MNRQKILLDPVLPTEEETKAIKLLDKMLCLKTENGDSETLKVKLLEVDGEEIALPESLYQLLCQAAHLMQGYFVLDSRQGLGLEFRSRIHPNL